MVATTEYFVPKPSGCDLSCDKMTKVVHNKISKSVDVPRKPSLSIECDVPADEAKPKWSQCDPTTCLQEFFVTESNPVDCQCQKAKRVITTRQCCEWEFN